MRTQYILIDFENVQQIAFSRPEFEHFKVILFVGANQNKVSVELAESIQRLGSRARYVRISGNGKNALDFHIAFYIGEFCSADPNGLFFIVSKDTGFDPLIQHLKKRSIRVSRVKKIESIPNFNNLNPKPAQVKSSIAVRKLQQMKQAKPKTRKALVSTVDSHFAKKLSPTEIQAIIQDLENTGFLSISDSKVTYS